MCAVCSPILRRSPLTLMQDSDIEDSSAPGKPGRKKNPKYVILASSPQGQPCLRSLLSSQAARRDQNRIAQREFRLRKQQKIRDLETRVEILSGGADKAVTEMRNMLKDLMDENQTLRTLLRSLGAFIGEGAGGLLPKLGWDLQDFNSFINRSETDTAWQGYQSRKKSSDSVVAGQKRSADDESPSSSRKKTRADEPDTNGYLMTTPNMYGRDNPNLFNDLIRNGSPIFSNPSPTSNQFAAPTQPGYQSSYLPAMGVDSNLPPLSFPSTI